MLAQQEIMRPEQLELGKMKSLENVINIVKLYEQTPEILDRMEANFAEITPEAEEFSRTVPLEVNGEVAVANLNRVGDDFSRKLEEKILKPIHERMAKVWKELVTDPILEQYQEYQKIDQQTDSEFKTAKKWKKNIDEEEEKLWVSWSEDDVLRTYNFRLNKLLKEAIEDSLKDKK